jgi:virginiamycin B lyase
MLRKVSVFLALGVMALVGSACSAGRSPMTSPVVQTDFSRVLSDSGNAVHYSIFMDMPDNPSGYPWSIASDGGRGLWVADDVDQDAGESVVAHVDSNGHRTAAYFYSTQALPSFSDLVLGPDGNVWIADEADEAILKMTPSGRFTTYGVSTEAPMSFTVGPDGALWVAEIGYKFGAIERVTTGGKLTKFKRGISNTAELLGITAGPDGALWFTDYNEDRIGRITTGGRVSEFSKGITAGAHPQSIVAGSDGALWFTENGVGGIGRITTAGKVTEYRKHIASFEHPIAIAAGPGGLWFTETDSNGGDVRIARIATDGSIALFPYLAPGAGPLSITKGPDGHMWFVEQMLNRIGRVDY